MSEYLLRELELSDVPSLIETFNTVFAHENQDFRPRTRSEWAWAFEANPAGRRAFVTVLDGQVVAQYAAQSARVWCLGREATFGHIVDSMVHPDHRAGLRRASLFVKTAQAFFDAFGGPDRDLVYYGWPVDAAWRVGVRSLEYEALCPQLFLGCPLEGANVEGRATSHRPTELPAGVEVVTRFDHQAVWLYERCVGAWGASTIRDAAYLNWRFHDHPRHRYLCLGVRDADAILRGLAVVRTAEFPLARTGTLVEWLVPPDEVAVGELLLEAVRANSRAEGALALACVFPSWSPWFATFQEWGFRVYPSDYWLAARSFHPRIDAAWLRANWWYQLSDSDLV